MDLDPEAFLEQFLPVPKVEKDGDTYKIVGCDEDNGVREEKLRMWQKFYMFKVSAMMEKLRSYKRKHHIK